MDYQEIIEDLRHCILSPALASKARKAIEELIKENERLKVTANNYRKALEAMK